MPFIHTSLQSCVFCIYLNLTSIIANRKKAEARKTGGGPPPPPPLTEAEEMALSQNSGRPIAEGISGGSSPDPPTPQDTGAYIKGKLFK